MANPVPEVQPEEVHDDVAIMATGRSDYPNQINNVLAFPGVLGGVLGEHQLDDGVGEIQRSQPRQVRLAPGAATPAPHQPTPPQQLADPVPAGHQIAAQVLAGLMERDLRGLRAIRETAKPSHAQGL
jgi:hypothetical protein